MSGVLELAIPDDVVERIAERAAEIMADRQSCRSEDDNGYLDVDGAAAFLACPKSRIYALVSAKRIPHHRDGSRLLFDRAELRAWVASGGATRP